MAHRLSLPSTLSWQPQSIPRLARGAITENLLDAIFPYGGTMVSVNRWGTDVFSQTASPTQGANKYGKSAIYNGSTQYHSRASAPAPLRTAQSSLKEITMLVALKQQSVTATTEWFSYGNSASSNPLLMLGVGTTSSKVALRVRDTAGTDVEKSETTSSAAIGETRIFIATRSESQNTCRIYRDGALILDTTAGSAVGSVSFDRTATGGLLRSSFALGNACEVSLAASWFRSLSFDEALRLSANPWQLFEFPSRPLIINSAAAAAAVSSPVFQRPIRFLPRRVSF